MLPTYLCPECGEASTDHLLTVDEVSGLLRVPVGTFRSWRSTDDGPRSFKIGRRVVYRACAVAAYVAAQEQATAKGGAA